MEKTIDVAYKTISERKGTCPCGKKVGEGGWQDWRWNGHSWQHYHGYPVGYINVILKPDAEKERP